MKRIAAGTRRQVAFPALVLLLSAPAPAESQLMNPIREYLLETEDPVFLGTSSEDDIYILGAGQIVTYTHLFGQQVLAFGSIGIPAGLALDRADFVYAVDARNNLVNRYTSRGQFAGSWGSEGLEDGQFTLPRGIAVDEAGNVYVVQQTNPRVQRFSRTGEFQLAFGTFGKGEGQFDNPKGIAADRFGFVYVADTGNNRIQKFDADGTYVDSFGNRGGGPGQFRDPTGVRTTGDTGFCIMAEDEVFLYVVDTGNNRIQVIGDQGVYVTEFSTFADGQDSLAEPSDIAFTHQGFFYVADAGLDEDYNRVFMFAGMTPVEPVSWGQVKARFSRKP